MNILERARAREDAFVLEWLERPTAREQMIDEAVRSVIQQSADDLVFWVRPAVAAELYGDHIRAEFRRIVET